MANQAVVGILRALLTADTAQYEAGLKRASQANTTFLRQTEALRQSAQKLTPQAERMVKAFQGDKLLFQANNLVAAVGKIGGASKLTETEQRRVNATITAALDKYRALGQQAPAAMVALEQATRKVQAPTDRLSASMVAIGAAAGTLAAQLGQQLVRSILAMGREAFRTASNLVDLSAKTGESTTSLQRMKFVADQVGVSFESMSNGAFMLRTRIAGGNTSVLAALDELRKASGNAGLSVKSSADEILRSLSAISDADTRLRLGTELFGRSFREFSAAVVQGYGDMADAANVATDEQLKALDRAADRWAKFITNMKTGIAASLGNALLLVDAIREVIAEGGVFQSTAAVVHEAQRRIAMGMVAGRKTDIQLSAAAAKATATYVQQLQAVNAALNRLEASQRAELAAAQELGASQEEQIAILQKWGFTVQEAEGILKLFTTRTAAAEKEARALGQMLEQNRLQLQRLNSVLQDAARTGIPLSAVLEEFGSEIETAAQKGVIFGQTVPPAVNAAAAAFIRLGMAQKEVLKEMDFGAVLGAVPDEFQAWDAIFDAIDLRQKQSLDRRQAASVDAAQFDIDLAQRRGANERELFALTEALERAKLDAALGAEDARFEVETRFLDKNKELFKELERGHQETVNHLNRQWQIGVLRRSALFESEAEKFGRQIRQQFAGALTGNLGSLFFGNIGHDPTGELKSAAQEAELEFLKIQRTGRATAKELQTAFERWRDAEERANFTFGERWKQWLGGLKETFVSILNDMLDFFLRQFIGGMVKGLSAGKLAQTLGGFLTGATGGWGFGGAVAQTAGAALPGGILTGAAGGAGAGAVAATSVAGSTLPSFGASAGILAAGTGVGTAAGTGSAAAATTAAGGGGFGATLAGLATNPITIGVAAGAALGFAIWKKGLFRGGEEGVVVNPRRDKFLSQFAGFDPHRDSRNPPGFYGLAKLLAERNASHLFTALTKADSKKEFEPAQAAIVAQLARSGMPNVRPYHSGGFIPPGMTQLAVLHGGSRGEIVAPVARMQSMSAAPVVHHHQWTVQGWDGTDVARVLEREVWPRFNRDSVLNQHGIGTSIRKAGRV